VGEKEPVLEKGGQIVNPKKGEGWVAADENKLRGKPTNHVPTEDGDRVDRWS